MEFGAYTEAIVPALCGGLTFCLMAIYSYITIATPEEDRVFRFGIFAMFVTGAPFLGVFSGVLFKTFGYTSKLEDNSKKDSNNIDIFIRLQFLLHLPWSFKLLQFYTLFSLSRRSSRRQRSP